MIVGPGVITASPLGRHWAPAAPARFAVDDFDYVEEEWFISGEEEGNPYATTVLVRLPRDRSRFTGTVVVEPLHFSGIAPIWVYCAPYIMRSGHGWAMVASQKATTEDFLKASDPERYAAITIEGPESRGPASEVALEDAGLLAALWADIEARNRACSSILAQAGAAIRKGGGPFGGVRHLILAGHSETGFVVTNYVREAHATQRLADGASVYDGYFPAGFPSGAFRNVGVPLLQVMSNGDVASPDRTFSHQYDHRAYRREDSDDQGDPFRLYELAGVPHMGTRYFPYNSTELWVEQAKGVVRPDMHMSSLPHNELFSVGLHHLVEWVVRGRTPPRAERIETDLDGFFAKDEYGNTAGGVRCAQMDVPRKHYFPNVPLPDGALSTASVGTEEPFTPAEFACAYIDEADYRARFEARLAELVAEGWLLAEDAEYMRLDLGSLMVD